jgi:hypothetical protein
VKLLPSTSRSCWVRKPTETTRSFAIDPERYLFSIVPTVPRANLDRSDLGPACRLYAVCRLHLKLLIVGRDR